MVALSTSGGALPAAVVFVDTVTVHNPGNSDDSLGDGYGGVDYVYRIGTYEVTAGQYCEFLNAVAAADTYELYNEKMWTKSYGCKIRRSGSDGSYTYTVGDDWADRPVNLLTWGDAARFCNWLHNGQPTGEQDATTTEDGSYTLLGMTGNSDLLRVPRAVGATWVLPSEDEWYKAAYHANDGATGNYYDYPTGTNTQPGNVVEDPDPGNNANVPIDGVMAIGDPYRRTVVGEFENSAGPYGTFDQTGNVAEWTEGIAYGYQTGRVPRGGSHGIHPSWTHASVRGCAPPTMEISDYGFRIAMVAPEEPHARVTAYTPGVVLAGRAVGPLTEEAPGVVSVMVLPDVGDLGGDQPRPQPSQEDLPSVYDLLRGIGTRAVAVLDPHDLSVRHAFDVSNLAELTIPESCFAGDTDWVFAVHGLAAVDFQARLVEQTPGETPGLCIAGMRPWSRPPQLGAPHAMPGPDGALDIGEGSAPVPVDWNNDGLNDVLVGRPDGSLVIHVNTGQPDNPAFAAGQVVLSLDPLGNPVPRVLDWDGDGRKDLLVVSGEGRIILHTNTGTDEEPEFGAAPGAAMVAEGQELVVGENACIDVSDWTSDGYPDLIVGDHAGRMSVFVNTGTPGGTSFSEQEYLFDGASILDCGSLASPTVADVDDDGDPDILVGTRTGLVYYDNIGTTDDWRFDGSVRIELSGAGSPLLGAMEASESPADGAGTAGACHPYLFDWDGDGVLDLLVNGPDGSLQLYAGVPEPATLALLAASAIVLIRKRNPTAKAG